MQKSVIIVTCLIVLGLSACSISQSPSGPSLQLKLLPPVDGPEDSLLKQKVVMQFQDQDQDQQFVTVLRLQQDRLKLAALSATGQQLFFLEYDGEELIQKNVLSNDIPGRDVLAIIQFALWPSSSIRQHYTREDGWAVEISPQQRSLLISSGVILKVTYQGEVVNIVNYLHDYRLKVQPLEN